MRLLKGAGLVTDTRWGLGLTKLGCFFADEIVQQFFEPHHLPFSPDDYASGPLHPLKNGEIFSPTPIAAE
jgi:oxygen-independent coproporphyrinogen-3 oxidase